MAKINKKELEKLTPAERIKRLKQLEEENKKEIEEAGKLIKETQSQIEKEKILESVAVPETKAIDIGALFKEEKSLEATVREEAPPDAEKADGHLYQLAQAYQEAKELLYSSEPLDRNQLEWLDKLGERVEKIKYYSTTEELANLAVATRTVVHKLKRYHSQ